MKEKEARQCIQTLVPSSWKRPLCNCFDLILLFLHLVACDVMSDISSLSFVGDKKLALQ